MDDLKGISDAPLDPRDIHVIASGLISGLTNAVKGWKIKKELTYEGKTYRNYSITIADPNINAGAIFTQVQLIYDNPDSGNPIGGSLTETAPDANGSLREYHFVANLQTGTESEIRYVEYPYRQEESGQPLVNTKAAVSTAESMIQRLPQSD